MLTRREMLKRSVLLSLAPTVPSFLVNTARAALAEQDRRVLVVIQLDGGNDALNTIVPYRDDRYAQLRPQIKLSTDRLIKLSDEIGLNPGMTAAGKLFDAGQLAVVQGVGYPNPNRSHFESMAIWHAGRLDVAGEYGWVGRALDSQAERAGPHAVYAGTGATPLALWGRRSEAAAISSLDDMKLDDTQLGDGAERLRHAAASPAESELARKVAMLSTNSFVTAERLAKVSAPAPATPGNFQDSRLAAELRTIGALIKSDSPARVYYASQSGYDTHAGQLSTHSNLLRELSEGLKNFMADMTAAGLQDRVLLLAFSEFGRRAAENQSAGTDHGAAGAVFLAGPKLAQGIFGPRPDLGNLDQGDVKMSIDFRQVYASVLDQWLDIRPAAVLAGEFEELKLFGNA